MMSMAGHLGDVLNMEARRLSHQALGSGMRGRFLSRQRTEEFCHNRMPTVQDKEPREAQTQEVTSLLNTSKSSDRDAGVQM